MGNYRFVLIGCVWRHGENPYGKVNRLEFTKSPYKSIEPSGFFRFFYHIISFTVAFLHCFKTTSIEIKAMNHKIASTHITWHTIWTLKRNMNINSYEFDTNENGQSKANLKYYSR